MSEFVRIVEMSARDGLQNEKQLIATADKIELINRLSATGLPSVEATAFVSPKWVPQMADAAEVYSGITRRPGVDYPVLVPNIQGYERARTVGVTEVAIFTAASEAFAQKNTNASIAETLERFKPIMEAARRDDVKVRGYVSTVLGCPIQGDVAVSEVVRVAKALHDLGCYEISLGDTIGVGTATKARQMFEAVASEVPSSQLALHFHDTYGQALANIVTCIEAGARVVDASVSGAGGCPYAKGATGNVATEDVIYLLHGLGMETGVNLDALTDVGAWLADLLGHSSQSRAGRALLAKRNTN